MKQSNTAERLKLIMAERNLKQVDILNRCAPYCKKYNVKLGRSDLSQYISGKAIPKQDKLTVLAEALNVTEPYLMGYDDEEKNIDDKIAELIKELPEEEKATAINILSAFVERFKNEI